VAVVKEGPAAELPGVTSLYVGVNPVAEAFPSAGFSVY